MLLFYCERITPRIRYVVKWIMHELNCEVSFTESRIEYLAFRGAGIAYTNSKMEEESGLQIFPSGFMEAHGVKQFVPTQRRTENGFHLFPDDSELQFDILSAVFYLISRYEEYLPFEPDRYGRFRASDSIAYRNEFLQVPIVDTWINGLGDLLQEKFSQLKIERPHFRTLFTYDIDVAFKYLGRGAGKSLLAAGRDMLRGKWKEVIERRRVLQGRKSDPWDVYKWIKKELNTAGIEGIFFFLTAGGTQYDHNVDVSRNEIKDRIFTHAEMAIEVGIHPSFRSSEIKGLTVKEKKGLEKYLARTVTSSRQHFLKFRLPDTYRELSECGIVRDFSMAFPEIPGFRAGTSRPFPFYDLLKEQETSLMIYPSCWMDATYINYGNQSADKAEKEALGLLEAVKAVGGYFIPIFHNNVLEDKRYRNIHHLLLTNIVDANKQLVSQVE